MRLLMIGDIVGRPGRKAVKHLLPGLRYELELDMVIANGENAAGGKGLTPQTTQELLNAGVDVITSGNHIWAQKEIFPYLDGKLPIIRPLNYSPLVPGQGYMVWENVLVINLTGRTFMNDADCPFRIMDQFLEGFTDKPPIIIVDLHAEATSEKNAMGYYLDGRVSAVLGTHTHVGTSDARILPHGTAYITDVGMVGPSISVIGNDINMVLQRFLTQMPNRLPMGEGPTIFNSVLIEIEKDTGRAISIDRVDRKVK